MNAPNPCLACGACCAHYRVSFYWSEAEPFLGGTVPAEYTERLNPWRAVMRGTSASPVRCAALEGEVGKAVRCTIYSRRPSPCHELEPWEVDGQPSTACSKARAAHGLPPLAPKRDAPHPPKMPWPITA